jgi:hypothetical protein
MFGRFGRDRRGVSAVEFALLAPIMITLYFGCVEVSDGWTPRPPSSRLTTRPSSRLRCRA